MKQPASLRPVALWVLLSAFLTCTGLVLSALHALNAGGYLAAACMGAVALSYLLRKSPGSLVDYRWSKLKWRARHGLPAIFYLLTTLAFLGGILYTPSNYDALTYRVPRILHWLFQSQWHWIETPNTRMNYSGTGFEWFIAPLLLFKNGDRFFFLANIVCQLLLPSLVYSAFTQLGMNRRVAWFWMWLLPCGYCFALQSGSIGNDTFATPYFLAALVFTLRARKTQLISDLWLGTLSMSLTTGVKASNLPLLLPWALCAFPSWRLLKSHLCSSFAVAIIACSVSFLPLAFLNSHFSGDWAGDSKNLSKMKLQNPMHGFLGNGLQLLVQNAAPSVNPFCKKWNEQLSKLEATHLFREIRTTFPRMDLKWGELAQEETAGLGAGLSSILLISAVFSLVSLFKGGSRLSGPRSNCFGYLVALSGYAALLAYMAKLGSESGPRLIAAFYPIVVVLILLPSVNATLVRRGWYRALCLIGAASAILAVILTPSRPLWPALTILEEIAKNHPQNAEIQRVQTVYSVYRNRSNALAPLLQFLPENSGLIGFAGMDDPQVGLWRPFGSRCLLDLTENNSGRLFEQTHFLIGSRVALESILKQPLEGWLNDNHAQIAAKQSLWTKIGRGPQEWFVVKNE